MSFRIIETPTRSVTGSKGEDRKITQTLQRAFTLDTDDANENQVDAKNALRSFGVFEGASYPGSQFFYCSSVAVNQVGPISYEATASYASIPYDEDENPEGDPTLERPEISYSSVTTQVETDVDVDGHPVTNAAGELYTGVMVDVTDAVVIIKKRYSSFSPAAFSVYRNKVNDAPFMGFPAGRLRVTNLVPQEIRQADKIFWEVTVELTDRQPLTDDVTDQKAWWVRKRNEGFYQLAAGANKRTRCLDANREPVTIPAPLSVAGVQINDDATPNFLYFEIYKSIDFSEMQLGVT